MKTIKYISIKLIIALSLLSVSCKAQSPQPNIETAIIGTWIAEDDPKVKLVFSSDGKIFDYYDNELTDTFTYSFSHECGTESDPKAWFLRTTDQEDLSLECYEVYGADANNNRTLSMRSMRTGKLFVYTKQ